MDSGWHAFVLDHSAFPESDDEVFLRHIGAYGRSLYDSAGCAGRRRDILYAHLLLGYAYHVFTGKPVGSLVIGRNANGKPYSQDDEGFCFSISHSKGHVAVAVCESDIGIDIEKLRVADVRLPNRIFSAAELLFLNGSRNKTKAFLEVWTRKESIVKFTGSGLSGISKADSFADDWRNFVHSIEFDGCIITVCCKARKVGSRGFPIMEIRRTELFDFFNGND